MADEGAGLFYRRWLSNMNNGAWNLLGFSYDGSNAPTGIQIYANGNPGSTATGGGGLTGTLENTGSFIVGGRNNWAANEFTGKVCHSFVYDGELSAAQWVELYSLGVPIDLSKYDSGFNLVHWSTLGDGCAIGAANMIDLSGLGNHGTFLNGEPGDFVADVPP